MITLIMLFSSLCHASPDELPVEFQATYSLETYGIIAAKATYSLKHKSNGLEFTQFSEPVGFAALFKKDTIQETSHLSLQNGQLLLNDYTYIQKGDDKDRDVNLKIDWIVSEKKLQGQIRGTASGDTVKLNTNKPVWDTLSFQMALMKNTKEKTPDWDATILVKGQLRSYLFVTHGTEEITVGGNTLKTIKVERKGDNDNKPIFFWIAPKLSNLPVKIEKWKNGKASITMLLDAATFPADKNLQFKTIETFNDL